MDSERYPVENMKKWQDEILAMAKKNLREDGALRPVAFFLTEKMSIEESMQRMAVTVHSKGDQYVSLASDDVKPSDLVIIILDLALTSEQALEVIKQTVPKDKAEFISGLEYVGLTKGPPNSTAILAKVLMERLNITIKDVVARAIELVIKKTDAIAYIKLDETWMVEAKGMKEEDIHKFREENGSLEHHPNATEAITSFLETDGMVRMVTINFRRNRPKVGRIIGFDDPKEVIETAETATSQKVSGRFAHLFDKAKAGPKAPLPPDAN